MQYRNIITSAAIFIASTTASLAKDITPEENRACIAEAKATSPEEFDLFRLQQVRATPVMSDAKRMYYGPKLDQYGDLRLPSGPGPFPVAIIIHGGAWSAVVNSDYTAPIAEMLTKSGIATWNIEYSRLGSGGEWPNSFLSVGAATDYLRDIAKEFPLDLNKVITVGHSSGGHYALWLAMRGKLQPSSDLFKENPLKITGVLSLDGTPDIRAFSQLARGKVVIPALLGNADQPTMDARFGMSSPAEIGSLGVPQIFITQPSDRLPSLKQYVEKSANAGDDASYVVMCPANHFTVSDTENEATARLIKESIARLAK